MTTGGGRRKGRVGNGNRLAGSLAPALIWGWIAAAALLGGCGAPADTAVPGAAESPAATGPAAPAEEGPASDETAAEDPDLTLARQLLESDRAALFGGEEAAQEASLLENIRAEIASVEFGDDPEGRELARSLFGENPLLSERNPLLSNRERERWLAVAIKNVGRETALQHLREEARKMAEGEVDRVHWYEHVAKCEKVCNRIVSGLLHSHVQRVRELPHRLILFGTSRAELDPAGRQEVDEFLAELAAETHGSFELLLIGRASKTGQKDYNRRLSERRVAEVRAEVEAQGWGKVRSYGFGLGFEPPQITEEIARLYGVKTSLSDRERNQSVLIVAHRPADSTASVVSGDAAEPARPEPAPAVAASR